MSKLLLGETTYVTMHVIIEHRQIEPRDEKTNVLVSDLVRHKPGCTATEADLRLCFHICRTLVFS